MSYNLVTPPSEAKGGGGKEVRPVRIDQATKILLVIIAVLLFINLVNNLFSSKPAVAGPETENKGRYQISAWGAQAQNSDPRSGYYVIDTATGMVLTSKTEIHTR
jgi:hypothetical protein